MNACASVSAVIQDELTARVATHEHETIELSGLKGGVNDAHFKAVVRRCRRPWLGMLSESGPVIR